MAKPGTIILRKGREKSLLRRHPWVFSGGIDSQRSNFDGIEPGDLVEVRSHDGGFLGKGYINPHSQIRIRILTWDQTEALGPGWWRLKIAQAAARKEAYIKEHDLEAYRVVFGESDGLPGLIIDRYGDFYVIQALTLGVEVRKNEIVDAIVNLFKPKGIIDRSDVDIRSKEGLSMTSGLLYGEEPPSPLVIEEHGIQYPFHILSGQKTGLYLDQRQARQWLLTHPSVAESSVLNCFGYTGSFTACAMKNGADGVITIDASDDALQVARESMSMNDIPENDLEFESGDVFKVLRQYRDEEREFDIIILDPPKFAQSAKQVSSASRGYKDINLLAFQLLRPGGYLLTFSCSGAISPDLFQKIVFGAALDAGVDAQIVDWFNQPADHPVSLTFPESRYLKGLVCQVR